MFNLSPARCALIWCVLATAAKPRAFLPSQNLVAISCIYSKSIKLLNPILGCDLPWIPLIILAMSLSLWAPTGLISCSKLLGSNTIFLDAVSISFCIACVEFCFSKGMSCLVTALVILASISLNLSFILDFNVCIETSRPVSESSNVDILFISNIPISISRASFWALVALRLLAYRLSISAVISCTSGRW